MVVKNRRAGVERGRRLRLMGGESGKLAFSRCGVQNLHLVYSETIVVYLMRLGSCRESMEDE